MAANPWVDNEPGPTCRGCGDQTIVKVTSEGEAVLLCLLHTPEEAACWPLPSEKPDNLPDDPEKWPPMLFGPVPESAAQQSED